jgi:cupin fold WbuC family metalloprotein
MKKIDSALLKELMEKSRQSARKRINLNFHYDGSDPLQRMLNAMQPGTYLTKERSLSHLPESLWYSVSIKRAKSPTI